MRLRVAKRRDAKSRSFDCRITEAEGSRWEMHEPPAGDVDVTNAAQRNNNKSPWYTQSDGMIEEANRREVRCSLTGARSSNDFDEDEEGKWTVRMCTIEASSSRKPLLSVLPVFFPRTLNCFPISPSFSLSLSLVLIWSPTSEPSPRTLPATVVIAGHGINQSRSMPSSTTISKVLFSLP